VTGRDDREGVRAVDMAQDWMGSEELAQFTVEELSRVMDLLGINHMGCYLADDGDVSISFRDIRDAETMVSLGVTADARPGTMYDRATASCLTLSELGRGPESPSEGDVRDAIEAGWSWTIHPNMVGRRMDWHVSVDITPEDASQLAANLNAMRLVNP
jgi:hypothetical protein